MNLYSLSRRFPTEKDALDHLVWTRWPKGIRCVACNNSSRRVVPLSFIERISAASSCAPPDEGARDRRILPHSGEGMSSAFTKYHGQSAETTNVTDPLPVVSNANANSVFPGDPVTVWLGIDVIWLRCIG